MEISVAEFQQVFVSHQEALKEEGKRIKILQESAAAAWKQVEAAERREELAKSDLADAHQLESQLRQRLHDLETKMFNTSRELYDLQHGMGITHLLEQQLRELIFATAANHKIASIKVVKFALGCTLTDAKKLVEEENDKGSKVRLNVAPVPYAPSIGDLVKQKLENG